MQSTDILKHEHRIIELVLNALEGMAQEAEAGRLPDRERAEKALELLRNFADKCHHGKEERELFKVLEARGMSHEAGPLAVMRQEHEAGREHIREMAAALAVMGSDPQALARFAEHARGYVELLRHHIWKEDHVLFPMAEQALSSADDQALVEVFEAVEKEEIGEGVHEKYHEWAHELVGEAG